ncbi:hypothetical protein [Marivita geojedonensis]|nr:hypothetical protein [Marivita geojedonensis]PRY78000.1 hypothetical protein CLV76_107187 [Marivita geojedonensis]
MFFKKTTANMACLAACVSIASMAHADTWWEVGDQTLYFEDAKDGMGVFVYLTPANVANPNFKLFLDEMEEVYYGRQDFGPATYTGYMANYAAEQDCGPTRYDAYGEPYSNWSTARMTFGADWRYFTLTLDDCGKGQYVETLDGTPGK